jgi:arsenate reductase (thioredoxin)
MSERVVLFICVGNASRSLMAEAMFNADPAPGWVAESAGTRPAPTPNPRTGPMLAELGLRLPDHPPRLLSADAMEKAALRISMGCLDDASCPARLKQLEVRDWALPDPIHLDDAGYRAVRDSIQQRVRALRQELASSGGSSGSPPPAAQT